MMPPLSSSSVGDPVHAAHGGGGQVADGLHRVDHIHNGQRDAGGGDKVDLKGHDFGQGKPARGPHAGKVHHAQHQRHGVAHDHAEQQRALPQQAGGEVVQNDHHREGDERHGPALHAAKVFRPGAARHVPHGGGIERQADGKDHRSGDHRREQLADWPDKDAKHHRHQAADDLGPQDGGQAELGADGGQCGHIGEAGAHDDGQARADFVKNREEL